MKGVENFKRRTWNAEEYERLALEREDHERTGKKTGVGKEEDTLVVETEFGSLQYAEVAAAGPAGSSKAYLDVTKARGGELDLDAKIGTLKKVEGGSRQAGYHCPVCDRVFQDSNALLDHINSREHQSRLGFSMHVATSSNQAVKSKLNEHIGRVTQEEAQQADTIIKPTDSLEERIRITGMELKREKEARKQERKAKKKQKRMDIDSSTQTEADPLQTDSTDAEMMASLGFAGFKGS